MLTTYILVALSNINLVVAYILVATAVVLIILCIFNISVSKSERVSIKLNSIVFLLLLILYSVTPTKDDVKLLLLANIVSSDGAKKLGNTAIEYMKNYIEKHKEEI